MYKKVLYYLPDGAFMIQKILLISLLLFTACQETPKENTAVEGVSLVAPTIDLQGSELSILNYGETYEELGYVALDGSGKDIGDEVKIISDVNSSKVGTYRVLYYIKDSSGHIVTVTRIVKVVDRVVPQLTLLGDAIVSLEVGSQYEDAGAEAYDNVDGNITDNIVVTNLVDMGSVGTYIITYNVKDKQNNQATEITRTINVMDSTKPQLTLIGDPIVSLEIGSVYLDLGAEAYDYVDGNISHNIVVHNPVDMTSLGEYTITYNVKDAQNNEATEISRRVNVVDTTKPLLTLRGESVLTIEVGTPYEDLGAVASDNADGNITSSIVVNNSLNMNVLGSYTIVYNVEDMQHNHALSIQRVVQVVDTTKPLLTLRGEAELTVEVGESYVDKGATSTDNVDGNITSNILVSNPLDMNTLGNYVITYNVEDSQHNQALSIQRLIHVVDIIKPVLTLVGASEITVEVGESYVDEGATAIDNVDGNITANIVLTNPIDTNMLGAYTLTYNVEDNQHNSALAIQRVVHVVDTTKPVLTLLGDAALTLEVGESYVDEGATAVDNVDGNISASIVVDNPVDSNALGNYTIRYTVEDTQHNEAVAIERVVHVVDTTKPVLTLLGDAALSLEVGENYVDKGAIAVDNVDGNISASIVVDNPVDSNALGDYTIRYTVEDAQHNEAVAIERVVHVVDTTKPLLTLLGKAEVTVEMGDTYSDAGATAMDNVEGNISANIEINNPVNTESVGDYTITYAVEDSQHNQALEIQRLVHVVDTFVPASSYLPSLEIDENKIIYASPNATGDGLNRDNPTSLSSAILNAEDGYTIIALDGVYTINITISTLTNVNIMAEHKYAAKLDAGGDTVFEFTYNHDIHHVRIEGFEVYGGGNSMLIFSPSTSVNGVPHHIYLADLKMHDLKMGVYSGLHSHDWTMDRCSFYDGTMSYIWYAMGFHHTIQNSVMYNNPYFNLALRGHYPLDEVYHYEGDNTLVLDRDKRYLHQRDWTHIVRNNTFGIKTEEGRGGAGMALYYGDPHEEDDLAEIAYLPPQNVIIENNIFADTVLKKNAIEVFAWGGVNSGAINSVDGLVIRNNVTNKSEISLLEEGEGSYSESDNTLNITEYGFADVNEGNYTLTYDSTVLIDKGFEHNKSTPYDFDNTLRDDGHIDIGAYEYKE